MEFYKETEFQETEIGRIPKDWEVIKLEKVCEILDNQRVPLNGKARREMRGDIPYYGANGVMDYINDYIYDDKLILIAEDGGYFNEYATRPIAYMVEGKCWVNNHAHVLKVKESEGFVSEFIFYSLEHKNIIQFIKGSTRSKLNQNELRKIPLAISCSKEEQRKIAIALSSIDSLIQQTDSIIQKTQESKKGLMQELLTKGIGHKEFKYSEELGSEIPKEWRISDLNKECTIIMGQSPPSETYNEEGKGLPFFQGNVDFGEKFPSTRLFCSDPKKIAEADDILISVRAPVGELNIADKKCCIGRGLAAIRVQGENSRDYIYYAMMNFVDKLIGQGSTFKAVGKKDLHEFKLPFPSPSEQEEIASIILNVGNRIGAEKKTKNKLEQLKKGLMQILLTGQVRIKVN